jgi:hypothetical protein
MKKVFGSLCLLAGMTGLTVLVPWLFFVWLVVGGMYLLDAYDFI